MYYDDQARRFNFLSGLAFGAVLGAGLALLVAPQERVRRAGPLQRTSRALKRRSSSGWDQLREGVQGSLAEALQAGRERLQTRGR